MSDQEEMTPSKQRNIDKFANIVKEKKRDKETKIKIANNDKEENPDGMSKSSSKSKNNSYVSAKRSRKDPSMFKFEGESDSEEESLRRLNQEKKGPKKIEINKNIIEVKRKELKEKEDEEEEKRLEELEKNDKVNDLSNRSERSNHPLKSDKCLNINYEREVIRRKSQLMNEQNILDPLELITSLKDKQFKDEMTGLLEKSFENHFTQRKELNEEIVKTHALLNKYENIDNRGKRLSQDMRIEGVVDPDMSFYTEYCKDDEINQMHMDGYNRFYKSDHYQNVIFREEEEEENLRINNKDTLLYKTRLIHNYFEEKKNISLPKFTKISDKDRKCQEIMKFKDNSVEERVKTFYDHHILLECRRFYFRIASRISLWCRLIVQNAIFDNISLAIILINTFLILISDPTDDHNIANTTDSYFLYIFTTEMTLKILSFGFILPDGSYLKDTWNIMDFTVVVIGWISYILERALNGKKIAGLSGLRAFRILRPLKTVKSIKGLRSLIVTLIESMMALSDINIVLFFFFLIFAIAGVQMFQGLFLKRCMSLNYGYFYSMANFTTMCTYDEDCLPFSTPGNNFVCAKSFENPNFDITHYDDTISALITVFIIASMEGWTDIWNYVSNTFKDKFGINAVIIFVYFHVLLFVGGYYLINLYLAVIKTNFTIISNANREKNEKKKQNFYDLIEEKYNYIKDEQVEYAKKVRSVRNAEEEAVKKLRSQYVFIKKNENDIPINYNTLKDILVIKQMLPKQQYELDKKVKKEANNIIADFKKKVKNIKSYAKNNKVMSSNTLHQLATTKSFSRRGTLKKKPQNKIYDEDVQLIINKKYITPSLTDTVKWFEQDLINSNKTEKKPDKLENKIQQKKMQRQKKEEEKKEISIKEDISLEIEFHKMDLLNPKEALASDRSQGRKATNQNLGITNANTNVTKSGIKKDDEEGGDTTDRREVDKDKNTMTTGTKTKRKAELRKILYNIEDEISFYSDNSDDEIEEENKKDEEYLFASPNKSYVSPLKKLSGTLASKKSLIDSKADVSSNFSLKKPFSLISGIIRHKDELAIKKKVEEKRKKFNVDEVIRKLKPVQISKIGRRKSFLNLLQFIDDKSNYDDLYFSNLQQSKNKPVKKNEDESSMEISLFADDDDLMIENTSINDIELMPDFMPNYEKVIDDELDYEERNKKNESNKYARLVRNSIFDNKGIKSMSSDPNNDLLDKINFNLNNMIDIDMKEPIRGPRRIHTKNFELNSLEGVQDNEEVDDLSVKRNIGRKAPSVGKNYYKYPQMDNRTSNMNDYEGKKEMENRIKEKKFKIPEHLKEKRKYYNYIYNIKDKDINVQDIFNADYWREDVLGPKLREIEQIPKPAERDPVFVFNDSSLNLKTYKYVRYRKYEFLKDEYLYYNHKLKNLTPRILDTFPPKAKNYGMTKIPQKFAASTNESIRVATTTTPRIGPKTPKKLTPSQANFGSNLHKSKSTIGNSLVNAMNHIVLTDNFKIKKGIWEKIHNKLNEFNYKTFSHYYLEDERLVNKIAQNDDQKQIVSAVISNTKEKVLEIKQQVQKIRVYDIETNSRKYVEWSGQQVINVHNDPVKYDEWNRILENLEEFKVILWKRGFFASLKQRIRYVFYIISISNAFDIIIISFVILNAFVMALDGNLLDPLTLAAVQNANYGFNGIFIMEFLLKFIGLGPIMHFSDPFTYLDVFIIGFAILDMTTQGSSGGGNNKISSQLSFLRVFRIFRVLRLTKVLRKIKAMKKIIKGIKSSLENVTYIILILVIFILIFQLLGMSLLNADPNYQSFLKSFYITFQVLSIENWNIVAYELMPPNRLSILYLVFWIFLGNYIIFNLFISILLDSFDDTNQDDDEDDEDELNAYQKRIKDMLPEIFDVHLQNEKQYRARLRLRGGAKKKDEDEKVLKTEESQSKSVSQDMNSTSQNVRNSEENEDPNFYLDSSEDNPYDSISQMHKDLKRWEKENNFFKGKDCEYSLFILPQTNSLRIWLLKLAENKKFDNFILLMIMLSTLRLIADTFVSGYQSDFIFDMCDICFTMIFLFECICKIVAFGFTMNDGTYLRDNWNKIDFLIVSVSIIDLQGLISKYTGSVKGSNLNFLKVLRLLRLLRPLRFISHNVQLKLIITSLFDSIVPIMNVLFVVLVVFFMFSIVGMNLFYDLYHSCYVPASDNPFNPIINFDELVSANGIDPLDNMAISAFCNSLGGTMDALPYYSFSNLFNSLITCYVLSNMEGWPNIMSIYNQFNPYYGIFFVAYLIVVSYFFLNLFIGIMFNCFNETWNKEKRKGIMNNQAAEKYWDFLKQIEFAKPEFATFKIPEQGLRKILYEITTSKFLDNFIMMVIIMNMILMAVSFEGSTSSFNDALDTINLVFTSIFICECTLKLAANGLKGYFYHGWNQFDFFVVASSIVDLVVSNTTGTNSSFLKSFQIIRVLRVLRVTRVLRLVKSLKGLERLLQTLKWSMTALSNIFILLFLVFSLFATMGCYLYDGIKYQDYKAGFININQYYNMDTFYNSFLLAFRCTTGESWPDIMNELRNIDLNVVSPSTAYIYMLGSNFVLCVIMLNLFILVTLQQYDEFVNKKENPIEKFSELLDNFKKAWNRFSSENDKGFKIKHNQVSDFFMDFEWSEMSLKKKLDEVKIYIMDMELLKDHQNFVYFHDVLFRLIKREIGGKVGEKIDLLTKEEDRLIALIKYQINLHIKNNDQGKSKVTNPLNKFNPLTSHLYYKTSFVYMKTFLNYYKAMDAMAKRQGYDFVDEDSFRFGEDSSFDDANINTDQNKILNSKEDDFKLDDNIKNEEFENNKEEDKRNDDENAKSLELMSNNISLKQCEVESPKNNFIEEEKEKVEDKLVIKENRF